jgi:hypothetical protein
VEHPVVDLDRPLTRRDREDVPSATVIAKESVVIERGQHVAVHRDKGSVETRDESKRRRRSKRLFLVRIRDLDAVRRAVAENRLDEVREIADAQRHVRDPAGGELPEHELED